MKHYNLLIIGAGAAGITAAIAANKKGVSNICIVDRDSKIGGVLNQCKHVGFGMGYFGENLSGIEFSDRLAKMLGETNKTAENIEIRLNTMVVSLDNDRHAFLSSRGSYEEVSFDKCILATGCRETTIQSLPVAGTRPEGIMTAGEAQKIINVLGGDIGDDIVILGTGDIGQVMVRHFIEQGKNVIAMIEQADHPGGLERNRKEILDKYQVPIITNTTVIEVLGDGKLEGVIIRNLVTGEEQIIACRTLITAMGLIPEQDIIFSLKEKQLPQWLRLCGNCDYVHDIVDSVCFQAEKLVDEL